MQIHDMISVYFVDNKYYDKQQEESNQEYETACNIYIYMCEDSML